MYRLSVLYGIPTDPRAFDAYYRQFHIPIAGRMKGLTRWTITPILRPTDGTTVPVPHDRGPVRTQPGADAGHPGLPGGPGGPGRPGQLCHGGATFLNGFEEVVDLP